MLDIPLLFEKKLEKMCDFVFLTYCPLKTRVERALSRKNISKKHIERIIRLQMPDRLKKNKSDFIINTSISKKHSNTQISKALNIIKNTKAK